MLTHIHESHATSFRQPGEQSPPNGTMRKLFADHVCALWRETQRDILSVDNNQITFQQVARGNNLDPAAIEALEAAGIDRQMINEYLQLNQRRSQIEPRASRVQPGLFGNVNRSNDAEFRRLQQLEQRIGGALQKGVSTKSVTFFDGTRYQIPQLIADDVHLRTDCQS